MAHSHRLPLIAIVFFVATCAVRPAKATEPPADLCSLLPAAELSKTLGRAYDSPQKTVAPRPFPNTAAGTDCRYVAKASDVLFRAYADPSPAAAADLFAKLSKFFGAPTPVTGIGDEAYFDQEHGLHVRKGKLRFYIHLESVDFTPAIEKQLKELANGVAGRL